MSRWLVKTEPSTYAWSDLVREGRTAWTGVSNPQAQANLRSMRTGDGVLVYHSGVKEAVGIAEVVREAYPEPGSDGLVCVDLRPRTPLPGPVGLDALRSSRAFARSPLLRQGRLSVVPLEDAQWVEILRLASQPAPATGPRKPSRPARRPARARRAVRP